MFLNKKSKFDYTKHLDVTAYFTRGKWLQ